jgi:transcriptional regulator with XRE-family HTH domain
LKENSEENLVKKTCRELGITQKQLSNITKIDEGNISRWNSNKRNIPKYIEKYLALLIDFNNCKKILKLT